MRKKSEVEKAERRLLRIKDPDHALHAVNELPITSCWGPSVRNATRTVLNDCSKALEIGLSRQEKAMAKLQLGAIAMQKDRRREDEALVAEAKRLDKGKLLDDQIAMVKQGLKRTPGQPGYFQQQQLVRGGRHR